MDRLSRESKEVDWKIDMLGKKLEVGTKGSCEGFDITVYMTECVHRIW